MTLINILILVFSLILSISFVLGIIFLLVFLFILYPVLLIRYNIFIKKHISNYNPKNTNINSVIIINHLFKDKKHKNSIVDKCKYIVAWGVPELLSKLEKYKRTIAIYENISSKTFDQIMDNKYITEVYIFSHGQKFGVGLSDKFYRYKNLLKITPKIKKNIICQLHCGGQRKMKSTDISLESFAKKCKIHNRDILLFENCFWILFKFDKFYNK